MIQEITNSFHFDESSGTLIQFHYDDRRNMMEGNPDIGMVGKHTGIGKNIKFWGPDNMLPNYRDEVLMGSNIVGELINTKRDFLLGKGLMPYTEVFEGEGAKREKFKVPVEIPDQVLEWIEKADLYSRYLNPAATNYYKHSNVLADLNRNRFDNKILYIENIDCKYWRSQEKINGKVPGYFIGEFDLYNTDELKKLDKDRYKFRSAWDGRFEDNKQPAFAVHVGDDFFFDGYYYHPPYWGGEEWIVLANEIPVFHKHNMKNGYAIRFHIKIPAGYFLDKSRLSAARTDAERTACFDAEKTAKQNFINFVNKFLAGNQNSGRSIFTDKTFDPVLKNYNGIEIEEVKYDMKDKSLLELFDKSNDANITAQGFPRALAGIETQGKLSSGSEIRNIHNFYVEEKLHRRRQDILKPFILMLKINGWHDPKVKWTFEDTKIQKLDENPQATTTAIEGQNQG